MENLAMLKYCFAIPDAMLVAAGACLGAADRSAAAAPLPQRAIRRKAN